MGGPSDADTSSGLADSIGGADDMNSLARASDRSERFLTARRRRAYSHEARTLQALRRHDDAAAFAAGIRALTDRPVATIDAGGRL